MSRLTLSERIAIESGIYGRLSLSEIAKRIGKSTETVSREIRKNRTIVKGDRPNGKDCRYAGECRTHNICENENCSRKCVCCHEYDCREICGRYDNSPCSKLLKPPYVCNVCERRRKCKTDRAYYIAQQADAAAKRRYSEARSKAQTRGEQLEKHEIIKARLSEHLRGNDLKIFSEIWESCSDMNRYIQQKYKNEKLFGEDFSSFNDDINIFEEDSCEKLNNKPTIKSLLDSKVSNIKNSQIKENSDSFQSIIDFPNFLLIVLKLTRILKEDNFIPEDFSLDDVFATLPKYVTTGVSENRAILHIKTSEHSELKAKYQKNFENFWQEKKSYLLERYGISSYQAVCNNGTKQTNNLHIKRRLVLVFFF